MLLNLYVAKRQNGQNGGPGGREASRSISFDETSRMVSAWVRRRKVSFRVVCCDVVGKN